MMLFTFALRHLQRHWRMNLVLFMALLITAVFLSALPIYANALASRSLAQTLADAPTASTNILVRGSGLTAGLYGEISDLLGPLLRERVEVREAPPVVGISAVYVAGEERPFDEILQLHPYAFSNLSQYVTVVAGRLPNHLAPRSNQMGETEAVIGIATAENLRLTVGVENTLTITHLQLGDQLRTADNSLAINIVGIVQPIDPQANIWWGDLLPVSFNRIDGGNFRPDTIVPSLLISSESVATYFPGYTTQWRLLTDMSQLNMDNLGQTQSNLRTLEKTLQTNLLVLDSSLIELIEKFTADLASARIFLFLLSIQSLLFVLYTVSLISSFLAHQTQSELATLAGRGFTSRQITQVFALQGVLLLLPAVVMAPFLARWVLNGWGQVTNTAVPQTIPPESWQLALLAAGFAWLTLVLSIFVVSHGNLLAWQQQAARPPQRARWQQLYLDFFLLALGGLLYWQLAETGTTLIGSDGTTADPFLLLGPSLLLIAVALLFLRLFPYLLRLANWWGQQNTGLVTPMGLARLSRDPVGPSQVILLISLAAGLTLFANTFEHSLTTRQTEMAHYLAGADLRLEIPRDTSEYAGLIDVAGVETGTAVYRNRSRWAAQLGREANLLAVDPAAFPQVARYAPFITNLTISDIMPALVVNNPELIPAVFSADAYPQDKQVGDRITYIIGQHKVDFEVRGIIFNFPAVESPFFITDLAALETAVDFSTLTAPWDGHKELWLAVDPAQHEAVVSHFTAQLANGNITGITADARRTERQLQNNLIALETLGAFNLNAVMLALLSITIFFLVQFFAARQRTYEFSVLRSIGLATEQLISLLSIEGALTLIMGLLAGGGLGYGLAYLMRSFLTQPLAPALGGDNIRQILLNWLQLGGLYGLLITFYVLALALLLFTLLRAGIHRVLRIGDE